jgi:hypothetical protein
VQAGNPRQENHQTPKAPDITTINAPLLRVQVPEKEKTGEGREKEGKRNK